jgi:hypothetical protein
MAIVVEPKMKDLPYSDRRLIVVASDEEEAVLDDSSE